MGKDRDRSASWPTGGKTVQIDVSRIESSVGSRRKTAFLTVIRGAAHDLGRHVLIEEGPVRLGRAPDLEFAMQDRGMSRNHARIEPQGDGYVITDLGFQVEVAQLVGQDPLTGLESKRRFDAALEFAVQNASQESTPLSLLMMDMDGVKYINDTHGHLFGAHVISETGRIIREGVADLGRVCRFGGDEFCAFLPGCTKEDARGPAEAIRRAVEDAGLEMEGIALRPTLSLGIAAFPADASDPRELLAEADAALYRAKAAGKNCVAT